MTFTRLPAMQRLPRINRFMVRWWLSLVLTMLAAPAWANPPLPDVPDPRTWARLSPPEQAAQRAALRQRLQDATPEERQAWRRALRERLAALPPEERLAIAHELREQWQALPPEERERRAQERRDAVAAMTRPSGVLCCANAARCCRPSRPKSAPPCARNSPPADMRSSLSRALNAWRRSGAEASPEDAGDDWRLWERAVAGDAASAERLVQQLMPQALGLARQLVGSSERAEDVVQESFLRLWRSRARDTGQARLSTYFNTIVLNRCRSLLAAAQREHSTDPETLVLLQDAAQALDGRAAVEPSHPSADAALLRAEVERLPPRQRMAIAMWTYADASVADIADALAIDANAAHQLLHRAKRKLRDALLARQTTAAELP